MSTTNNVVVLIRHGQSEWNEKNLFTGFKDPELTAKGREEAKLAAERLKKLGFVFDCAYTSALRRAQVTLDIVLEALDQKSIPIEKDQALNERDYGDLSGLNKDDAQMTAQRTLPYYNEQIKPKVLAGKKVLVAAHGNSLRSIIMQLEGLSGEEIVKKELDTGVPIIYELDSEGKVLKCTVVNS
ncbi:hypothetical protein KEM48_005437 [Puccinia striiformis f. sp. tritici PST-130]|nr:hypothetical protein KEM48_005437 [Puccinia striiformis f. sp. tritici PST-130]